MNVKDMLFRRLKRLSNFIECRKWWLFIFVLLLTHFYQQYHRLLSMTLEYWSLPSGKLNYILNCYLWQAEKKGCTATQYGIVFGVFELAVFLVSPIYGQFLNNIGPKVLFNAGIFTTGTAAIIFGLLDRVQVCQHTTQFIPIQIINPFNCFIFFLN